MNVYEAIMKAADHIESHPNEFNFSITEIPGSCGTPGCALGWIGFFYGSDECARNDHGYKGAGAVARVMGFTTAQGFYHRMNDLDAALSWTGNPTTCARTLRLYAAKYHAPAPVLVPDWNAMAAKQTVSAEARSQEMVS